MKRILSIAMTLVFVLLTTHTDTDAQVQTNQKKRKSALVLYMLSGGRAFFVMKGYEDQVAPLAAKYNVSAKEKKPIVIRFNDLEALAKAISFRLEQPKAHDLRIVKGSCGARPNPYADCTYLPESSLYRKDVYTQTNTCLEDPNATTNCSAEWRDSVGTEHDYSKQPCTSENEVSTSAIGGWVCG